MIALESSRILELGARLWKGNRPESSDLLRIGDQKRYERIHGPHSLLQAQAEKQIPPPLRSASE
jgi:hypothetical protein